MIPKATDPKMITTATGIAISACVGGPCNANKRIRFLSIIRTAVLLFVHFERKSGRFGFTSSTSGLRAHLMASRMAAPIMIEQKHGMIISTVAWDQDKYLGNLFYDVAKHAIVRMVRGVARELKSYNVAVLAVAPGFARTERHERCLERPELSHSNHGVSRIHGTRRYHSGQSVQVLSGAVQEDGLHCQPLIISLELGGSSIAGLLNAQIPGTTLHFGGNRNSWGHIDAANVEPVR